MKENTAQYKGSDYSNVVRVERGITLNKAFEITESDDSIDYFVYLKGYQMVLEIPSEVKIFFSAIREILRQIYRKSVTYVGELTVTYVADWAVTTANGW